MGDLRRARSGAVTAGLLSAAMLFSLPADLGAAQADRPLPEMSPPGAAGAADGASNRYPERRPCCLPPVGDWRDFVELQVRDDEFLLTNVSDRPIVAWTVRTVVRITRGNEGWSGNTEDHFGYARFPGGYEDLLHPGDSVSIPRAAGEPWIRPDLKGPEYLVYHDVGALVFENAEWVGVPEVVDRIFERRLDMAIQAFTALRVIDSGGDQLERLSEWYQRRLGQFPSRVDGLRAILAEATEIYETAVAQLRPEDLAELRRLEEELP